MEAILNGKESFALQVMLCSCSNVFFGTRCLTYLLVSSAKCVSIGYTGRLSIWYVWMYATSVFAVLGGLECVFWNSMFDISSSIICKMCKYWICWEVVYLVCVDVCNIHFCCVGGFEWKIGNNVAQDYESSLWFQ
jgi:hypothetical protein